MQYIDCLLYRYRDLNLLSTASPEALRDSAQVFTKKWKISKPVQDKLQMLETPVTSTSLYFRPFSYLNLSSPKQSLETIAEKVRCPSIRLQSQSTHLSCFYFTLQHFMKNFFFLLLNFISEQYIYFLLHYTYDLK